MTSIRCFSATVFTTAIKYKYIHFKKQRHFFIYFFTIVQYTFLLTCDVFRAKKIQGRMLKACNCLGKQHLDGLFYGILKPSYKAYYYMYIIHERF